MKRHLGLYFAASLLLAGSVAGRAVLGARTGGPGALDVEATLFSERSNRDVQISVWRQALAADSTSAIALGQLAALHLQRAREGGGFSDYLLAEELARRSFSIRTRRNASSAATLTAALVAQHRFHEARAVAARLVGDDPDVPQYRAILGEIAMEIGDDSTATAMFGSLWPARSHLSIAPRFARFMEIQGESWIARQTLEKARDDAIRRGHVSSETKSWFQMRVGDLAMRSGKMRRAERSYRAGLAIEPNDPRLHAALARLFFAKGDAHLAIEWGERAIELQLEAGIVGLVGDAYAMLGNSAKAAHFHEIMDAMIDANVGPLHREWMLQLLDRGSRVDTIVRIATRELETRRDVYAFDLLAWAQYKSGNLRDAERAIALALRLGTPDARLLFHSGMIARAVGDNYGAQQALNRAFDINPFFGPAQVRAARAILDSIARGV